MRGSRPSWCSSLKNCRIRRADEAHIMEVDDIPAPAFRYRSRVKKNTTVFLRSSNTFTVSLVP